MRPGSAALAALVLFSGATSARADAPTSAPRPAALDDFSPEELLFDEIIVTARRREERLHETPVSMTVFTGESIPGGSVPELTRIGPRTPNLLFGPAGPTPSGARIYVRGVGQDDPLATADPGVGVYLGGVYLGRAYGANLDLVDVERIEVMRGPQGTLYGKNTIGGAIHVVPVEPDGARSGLVRLAAGSDGRMDSLAQVSFPLVEERAFARVAVATRYKRGPFENEYDGADWDNQRRVSMRAALRVRATERLDLTLALDGMRAREHPIGGDLRSIGGCAVTTGNVGLLCQVLIPTFYAPPFTGAFALDGDRDASALNAGRRPDHTLGEPDYTPYVRAAGPSDNDLDLRGAALTASWELSPSLRLKSISAYRETQLRQALDVDASAVTLIETFDRDEQSQVSQELQLLGGKDDARLQWVAGLYYFKERSDNEGETLVFPLLASLLPILPVLNQSDRDSFDTRTSSCAAFASGELAVSTSLRLNAGLRWTHERKRFARRLEPLFAIDPIGGGALGAPPDKQLDFTDSDRWSAWSPKLGVTYLPWPELTLYASWSRGFKSGGFNGRAADHPEQLEPFEPETATAYELGLKSRWLDDRLILNAALFRTSYDDMQLATFVVDPAGGFIPIVENAGKARVRGLEVEARWQPSGKLSVAASLGLTDAEYQRFSLLDPATGVLADASDLEFKNTPRLSGSVAATYRRTLPRWGLLKLTARYLLQGKIYFDTQNSESIAQGKYGVLDARLSWLSRSGGVELALWGRNLTDRRYLRYGLDFTDTVGLTTGYWAPGRTLGLETILHF